MVSTRKCSDRQLRQKAEVANKYSSEKETSGMSRGGCDTFSTISPRMRYSLDANEVEISSRQVSVTASGDGVVARNNF